MFLTGKKKAERFGAMRAARFLVAPKGERRWLLGGTALTAGVVAGLGALIAVPTPARADCATGTNFITCIDMPSGETDPQTLTATDEWVVHVGVVDINDVEDAGTISIASGTAAGAALQVNAQNNSGRIVVTENSSITIADNATDTFNTRHGILVVPGGSTDGQLLEFVIAGSVTSNDSNGDGIQISGSGNATASATSNADDVTISVLEGGAVVGEDDGIQLAGLRGLLTITNAGQIGGGDATPLPFERMGIVVSQNLVLTDRAAGDVEIENEDGGEILGGNSSAIHIATAGDATITNHGTITGQGVDRAGVYLNVAGDVVIYNDDTISGVGNGIDVTGAASSAITNASYQSIVGGTNGINQTSIGEFSLDNAGGLVAGLAGDGVNLDLVSGADGVTISNRGRAGTGDEPLTLGGGVLVGSANGIDINNVQNGDVVINNNGYTSGLVDYSGGLIYGVGGSGIQITDADTDISIDNRNTYNWSGSSISLGGLNPAVSGFFPSGQLAGTSFTTGIWGDEHGIEIDGAGDDGGAVGIENGSGLIVGITDHAIEVSGLDGLFVDGEETDFYAAFQLNNGSTTENPEQGGLVWGGENAIDLWDIDGNVIVNNGIGTIFGRENGIEAEDIWRGGVLVTNGDGGLIQGLWGDAIQIGEVDSDGTYGGTVAIGNDGWILAGDRAIAVDDAGTVFVSSTGLIIGDGDTDEPVIEISGTDTGKVGTTSEAAAEIRNIEGGIIASRDLPHFLYSSWSSPDPTEVPASTFDSVALWADVTNFQSFVLGGQPLDASAMEDYADAAEDLIVETSDGAGSLQNDATSLLVGRVQMSGANDFVNADDDKVGNSIVNAGAWFVTGETDIDGASGNDVIMNGGWIQTAFDDDASESTSFDVDVFANSGIVSMADGTDGDQTTILGDYLGGSLSMIGENFVPTYGGGLLAVDVDFDDAASDRLVVDGDISGETGVVIRRAQGTGLGTYGTEIDVVEYQNNTSEPSDDAFFISSLSDDYYEIAGEDYIQDGFLAWFIQHDAGDDDYELVNDWGPGAQNAPAIVTGAQQIFYDTVATVEDHIYGGQFGQSGGGGADVVEMAPPAAASSPDGGIWGKVGGRWTERDRELTIGGVGVDGSSDQSTYSVLAGADFIPGDGFFRFGVFGGYVGSDMDFASDGSSVDYSGGTVGAYGAYNDGAFYADLTAKADFLNADYRFGAMDVDADVFNYGVYGNIGYRMARGTAFIEPLVSGAYVHTSVDDVAAAGHSVSFDDGSSARLGAGVRVGAQFASAGGIITEAALLGRIWNEFGDDNTVTVSDGVTTATFTDGLDGVFGEVTGTLTFKSANSGWSGFISGTGQFGSDYQSYGANAGLRVNF
ncbi:autotransporter outer membrane beta-barrel domain-containing protein [Aquibium microcysteis]|uniref:autotransporter outer membrane beta-barrel domain-containing protein n=1 Tax=Aquibium microcysteis TaxID=675281 RepID=UPI00165CF663|nr:autotransporter outer membrane beta-barrel domain-containing protein [Aquibium microcysteis]